MSRIRLILLDFDGTLVDTRRANARAYVETLREVGYAMTEEEYAARHFGVRCPEFLRSIGIDDPAEIDRLRRRPTKRSSSRIRPSASKRHAAAERPISS